MESLALGDVLDEALVEEGIPAGPVAFRALSIRVLKEESHAVATGGIVPHSWEGNMEILVKSEICCADAGGPRQTSS